MKHYCVAISGASGFIYAKRLLQCLLHQPITVHLLISEAAREVARLEHDLILPKPVSEKHSSAYDQALIEFFEPEAAMVNAQLKCWMKTDWLSPVASGSHPLEAMVVCPCSTGTLAAIANGMSNNLMERAATVCLKEHRRLVLLPREMPMGTIQLEHMHKLSQLGVRVLPASPGFYQKPKTISDIVDFVVHRVLSQMGIDNTLLPAWGADASKAAAPHLSSDVSAERGSELD